MSGHIASIFNDVVGPVMRGPSSSHSAAALRIGRMCRDLMDGDPGKVLVQYDRLDALATTHQSQGSDMGMMGGLLGFEADDKRLLNPEQFLLSSGIEVTFEVIDSGKKLPNLYMVHLKNQNLQIRVEAISTGGGMVEIINIEGCPVSMKGDYFETLVFSSDQTRLKTLLSEAHPEWSLMIHQGAHPFLEIKSVEPCDPSWISELRRTNAITSVCTILPVLPILSGSTRELPFGNYPQMIQYNQAKNLDAWQLALEYESARGGIAQERVRELMEERYRIMRQGVESGLRGTDFKDRIFGPQSVSYKKKLDEGGLSKDEALHKTTLYVSALMEVKSSMGTIVAAPTAGSCGTFPGAVLGVADSAGASEEEIVRALLAGSLVGVFIASDSTFSAEIGGCQAECGAGSGMAASAIVSLLGGTLEQSMAAASMALQNSLGMICDPIAARVEAPCLGKNIGSATNALACANMALSGYDHLVPLDEVIETMDRVGKSMPRELRCTALGGLAITPSAKKIEEQLRKNDK
jgi:L-serine dehydratase